MFSQARAPGGSERNYLGAVVLSKKICYTVFSRFRDFIESLTTKEKSWSPRDANGTRSRRPARLKLVWGLLRPTGTTLLLDRMFG